MPSESLPVLACPAPCQSAPGFCCACFAVSVWRAAHVHFSVKARSWIGGGGSAAAWAVSGAGCSGCPWEAAGLGSRAGPQPGGGLAQDYLQGHWSASDARDRGLQPVLHRRADDVCAHQLQRLFGLLAALEVPHQVAAAQDHARHGDQEVGCARCLGRGWWGAGGWRARLRQAREHFGRRRSRSAAPDTRQSRHLPRKPPPRPHLPRWWGRLSPPRGGAHPSPAPGTR